LRTHNVDFDVYVVDNGSIDGTVDDLAEEFPGVKVIANTENAGFAKANNMAISDSEADYVFLLNPDTVLVNNAVKIFLDFMEEKGNERVGCCGGSLYDKEMTPQIAYGNFPSLEQTIFNVLRLKKIFPRYYRESLRSSSENKSDETRRVDYIVGADMFIRMSTLEKTGLLDEGFFLYFEDTELCFRMVRHGFNSVIIPEAKIIHLVAQSSSKSTKIEKIAIREKSRFLFFRKCYGDRVARLVKALLILKQLTRLLSKASKKNIDTLKILYRS
jgi:GT2 family glycosyltransferase